MTPKHGSKDGVFFSCLARFFLGFPRALNGASRTTFLRNRND